MNKLGYYKVGNKIFFDKVEAILYANATLADIEWNFNDEILDKVNWTTEPLQSLESLYKIRAKQIRERFDYIVVMCSGGADSTNVIYSFLNNGIMVDEVIAAAPLSGATDYKKTDKDNCAENTINETNFAQMPLMNDLSSRFPSVKFTLNDYFDTMLNYKPDEWLLKSSDWIHPTTVARYSLEKFKHLRDIADSGKRLGIIYGIDKPGLCIDNLGNVTTVIADLAVNVPRPAFDRHYPNVENVLFYYTPELPELMVKQAHSVAKWMYKPENTSVLKYLKNIDTYLLLPFERNRIQHSFWEKAIIPCIYPGTVTPVFQAHKSVRFFFSEHDQWFYDKHHNTTLYQMIDSDFRNFIKHIDKKYLNSSKLGFESFRKSFYIGKIEDFKKPN